LVARSQAAPIISSSAAAAAIPGSIRRADLGHARQSLEINSIALAFDAAKTDETAKEAAFRAIAFYTKNSTRINAPLRAGDNGRLLDAFRRAVDYGLKQLPDFGQTREPLDRRVHFSREMLDTIIREGTLHDPAFISTSACLLDSSALSLRNTLIHIEAKYAADVSGISPDPHARENLLCSNSTLELVDAKLTRVDDEDDPLFQPGNESVRAELWMRQQTPEPR
jgi:hypothetical protein